MPNRNKNSSHSTPLLTLFVNTLGLFLLASCGSTEGNGQETMRSKYFSPNYAIARTHFRTAAEKAGGRLTALQLDAKGPNEEDLTIDIAWFGAEKPKRVLMHSSGLHGVEAFAGSAIPVAVARRGHFLHTRRLGAGAGPRTKSVWDVLAPKIQRKRC